MIAERKRDNRAVVNRTIHDRASLTQTWEPPRKRRTMAFRGPLILRGAQELRFRSPEALVVLVASFCVSMFCFYVAAYARVTADGINAVNLERQATAAEEATERLRAELSLVSGPANVERRAKEMKMIPGATEGLVVGGQWSVVGKGEGNREKETAQHLTPNHPITQSPTLTTAPDPSRTGAVRPPTTKPEAVP